MLHTLKTLALGIALMLPTAGAMARADQTDATAPDIAHITLVDDRPKTVQVSPIIGLEMGIKIDFTDRIALHLVGRFISGLHAGGTLKMQF